MSIIEQLRYDRNRALEQADPTATVCYLATVGPDLKPSVRTLVLRQIDDFSLRLFINASSPKWQALTTHPQAQVLLWYPSIQVQYRIAGEAVQASREDIENNWHRRPLRAKLLDYFYAHQAAQSTPFRNQSDFDETFDHFTQSLNTDELSPPSEAIAIDLHYTEIERLDLTQDERPHQRTRFQRVADSWQEDILIP